MRLWRRIRNSSIQSAYTTATQQTANSEQEQRSTDDRVVSKDWSESRTPFRRAIDTVVTGDGGARARIGRVAL